MCTCENLELRREGRRRRRSTAANTRAVQALERTDTYLESDNLFGGRGRG
jgi:hypothetical protein